jgi:SAM-dependent methyltransferase
MQTQVTALTEHREAGRKRGPDPEAKRLFEAFLARLRAVRVLDPACGSGNFLYIALRALKDLELEAIGWGSLTLRLPQEFPQVGPEAVMGIEINAYAAELARVTIWIGEIQWMLDHGFHYRHDPILQPLGSIATKDALLDLSDPTNPREAEWPAAEFVVGNPPFLGRKFLRDGLGDSNLNALFKVFSDRVPAEADLCCYWHEKTRAQISSGKTRRAGLLATQGIRGGPSRRVLERIKDTGNIFFAHSDEPWVLAGAAVHISFVGQDDGTETDRTLNGASVTAINADLTAGLDLTRARRLRGNLGVAFQGDTPGGLFELAEAEALTMASLPNPDGRDNHDVLRRTANGRDITERPRNSWLIDFGTSMSEENAALYEAPFERVKTFVKPFRDRSRRAAYRQRWWVHMEARPGMRSALAGLKRYIATPTTSKYRIFRWLPAEVLPSVALIAIARDDDFTLGVLQSRIHERWAIAVGTQLREAQSGLRYTPNPAFETFPFPKPTDRQREAIAVASRRLVELCDGWLNPPGLSDSELAERTLTNLYNERPTWLTNAQAGLDAAVCAAYGWPADLPDDQVLAGLLALNLSRDPA